MFSGSAILAELRKVCFRLALCRFSLVMSPTFSWHIRSMNWRRHRNILRWPGKSSGAQRKLQKQARRDANKHTRFNRREKAFSSLTLEWDDGTMISFAFIPLLCSYNFTLWASPRLCQQHVGCDETSKNKYFHRNNECWSPIAWFYGAPPL